MQISCGSRSAGSPSCFVLLTPWWLGVQDARGWRGGGLDKVSEVVIRVSTSGLKNTYNIDHIVIAL